VNVLSVEYEQFEDFTAIEDFQDPEQFLGAGKRQVLAAFLLILLQHAFKLYRYLLLLCFKLKGHVIKV
jgi:hypothetical protein